MSYTPGPWVMWDGWGPAKDGLMRVPRIGPRGGETVFHATAFDGYSPVDIIGKREDFELLARAPELLTALKEAAADVKDLLVAMADGERLKSDSYVGAFERWQGLIAQAEGRS